MSVIIAGEDDEGTEARKRRPCGGWWISVGGLVLDLQVELGVGNGLGVVNAMHLDVHAICRLFPQPLVSCIASLDMHFML